jgi:hypothetical protein
MISYKPAHFDAYITSRAFEARAPDWGKYRQAARAVAHQKGLEQGRMMRQATGNPVFSFALSAPGELRRLIMRTVIAILALTILAVASAAASSVPGHHAKGVHGGSSYAPGHVKKRMNAQGARYFSPGHNK